MNSYVKATPLAGAALATVLIDQLWLFGVAIALVGTAAVVVRLGYRRGRHLGER